MGELPPESSSMGWVRAAEWYLDRDEGAHRFRCAPHSRSRAEPSLRGALHVLRAVPLRACEQRYEAGDRREGTRRNFCPDVGGTPRTLIVSIIRPTIELMKPIEDLSEWPIRRLQLSIAGLISVNDAERDERGRFKRRFQPTARERQPSIPLRAEWWEAI